MYRKIQWHQSKLEILRPNNWILLEPIANRFQWFSQKKIFLKNTNFAKKKNNFEKCVFQKSTLFWESNKILLIPSQRIEPRNIPLKIVRLPKYRPLWPHLKWPQMTTAKQNGSYLEITEEDTRNQNYRCHYTNKCMWYECPAFICSDFAIILWWTYDMISHNLYDNISKQFLQYSQ